MDNPDPLEVLGAALIRLQEIRAERNEAVKLLKRTMAHIATPKSARDQLWHIEGEQLAADTHEFIAALEEE